MKLDAIDLRILEAIQHNGRITKLALAELAGLSATPCWFRLRRLEKAGVVTGYHANVAVRRVSPVTSVLLEISLANHRQADFDHFERAVKTIPEIITCWSVGGGVDYILNVMTTGVSAYQQLLERLLGRGLGIDRYMTYIVTKTVKEQKVLPLTTLLGDLQSSAFPNSPQT